jgi:hypothetical protein
MQKQHLIGFLLLFIDDFKKNIYISPSLKPNQMNLLIAFNSIFF